MKPCKLAWKNKSTLISPIRSFGSIVPGKCPESDKVTMTDDDDAELEESILARFDCSPVRVELLA
ncbi:hypothetical protein M514_06003 [Trichuris suis]|uniref:Uncharacterized protein n=1 Tax=Trichuris suis TaxID=68888 RepID=A0A085MW26_9BILA|nr:hypothetical protein M514_06003 [Trichuris suis]